MKITIGMLLALIFVGSAVAQSGVDSIAKTQAEIDGVSRQISNEQTKVSHLQAQLTARSNEFDAIKARHDALQRQYTADSSTYNSNCAGRPASYGNCSSWRAKVLTEQQQLAPVIANMERRANELNRQGQQLSNELVLSNARVQKLINYKSQLEANVRNLKANFVQRPPAVSPAQTANRLLGAAPSTPATQVKSEWTCQRDLPQMARNSITGEQFCIGVDAVPCSGPTQSWSCTAHQSCNGDGTDPKVNACRG